MYLESVNAKSQPELFQQVLRFYKAEGYKGRLKTNELVWIYKEGNCIIAAARLINTFGCKVLRGVWVSADYQGRGIGSEFLQVLKGKGLLRNCYTFPYLNLENFYSAIGFELVDAESTPLKGLLKRYNRKGKQVLLMYMPDELC